MKRGLTKKSVNEIRDHSSPQFVQMFLNNTFRPDISFTTLKVWYLLRSAGA